MSSACIQVDYLSHNWDVNDLICTHAQTRKQIRKIQVKRAMPTHDAKEQRALVLEYHRLCRCQNALWRQMARTCTPNLGRNNPMVNPSTVNWQKESDITWLYGPLYTKEHIPPVRTYRTHPAIAGLKPVLKKTSYRIEALPHFRSPGSPSMSDDEDDGVDRSASFSSTSTACTTLSSTSTQVTGGVRFSPEITKVQYFLPESPVRESLGAGTEGWNPYFDDYAEDDADDDTLWNMVTGLYNLVKSTTRSRWLRLPSFSGIRSAVAPSSLLPSQTVSSSSSSTWSSPSPSSSPSSQLQSQSPPQLQPQPPSSPSPSLAVPQRRRSTTATLGVIVLSVSVVKNVTSLMAAWLVFQSLQRLVRILQRSPRTGARERKAASASVDTSSSASLAASSA